jgi:hypothetical protein
MSDMHSRREMLKSTLGFVALVPTWALIACKGKLACDDTTGLAPADLKQREDQNYLDTSADPTKVCDNCAQNQPAPKADTCGTCKVLKGPVNPKGSCKLWAAKT